MDALRIFSWQVRNNLTHAAIAQLPFVFPDRPIPSWKVIMARSLHLAGIEPIFLDCCINSCMAFTGSHEKLKHCIWCKQSRHNSAGKPRKRFCYLPLIMTDSRGKYSCRRHFSESCDGQVRARLQHSWLYINEHLLPLMSSCCHGFP
jgi:hypothetical protein